MATSARSRRRFGGRAGCMDGRWWEKKKATRTDDPDGGRRSVRLMRVAGLEGVKK